VIDLNDFAQAARVAHTLKGMSANMSLKRGTALIAGVEVAAHTRDILSLRNALVSFDSEMESLSAAIDEFLVGA
jgi:HPt (histidine-containing phosphotransfer) domain-containing protein